MTPGNLSIIHRVGRILRQGLHFADINEKVVPIPGTTQNSLIHYKNYSMCGLI